MPTHTSYHLDLNAYRSLYEQSIINPNQFWSDQAIQFLTWFEHWEHVQTGDFFSLNMNWFKGGKLNACYNCVDRHLAEKGHQLALIWEGNEPGESRQFTYHELHTFICKFANVLKKEGVKQGDRVCIYLPMIPEAVIAMLACARLGAIHVVVFGGFSPDSLRTRIQDTGCQIVITADEGLRADKSVPLKKNCDQAVQDLKEVRRVIVVKRTGHTIPWQPHRDVWYHEAIEHVEPFCEPVSLDATAPLFILHTSGSTGQPKGILHGTGGYLLYAAMTHHYIFNYHPREVYWCTADIGWITGHTYTVYGPLANGATVLIFEGVPQYPTFSRYWEIIDKHQVNIFYTAPTAIRALRHEGDDFVTSSQRTSLKLLGSVGEPLNPEVWQWYFEVVGEQRCPIVDTWWQTETGGILLSPLPGVTEIIPGTVGWPFFGVKPDIVNEAGESLQHGEAGSLVIRQPWPSLMQTIYGNPQRFVENYFQAFPGCYLSGDAALKNEGGYYTVIGRNDDVIKVSGHRLGTEEIESALLSHPDVSEAAAIGMPDPITGESIYAFVTVKPDIQATTKLKKDLIHHVRQQIGPIATIKQIHWAKGLPKTRSGKIMRRILKKIANDEKELGDLSTLANPDVIKDLS